MRIHGATPEWMQQMKQLGYDHVDLEKLIAFRIHGVSPEFIDKVQSLGYKTSRSGPVDRDANSQRHSGIHQRHAFRGIKDLSIDQLVSMRIHGID